VINRAAVILRYKGPAVAWINAADPCDRDSAITLEAANEERTVYLISDEDADTGTTLERWIRRNYRQLFESELEGWYTDPTLWPEDRSLNRFKEWFDVECHTVLVDTVGGVICDDDV
jgi:hypothetical protein